MRASKLWFAIVVLAGGLSTMAALLVPRLVQRDLDEQVQRRLSSIEHGAEALMKVHARRWLDACAHAAFDGTLGEALEAASHGASNLELLHKTAQERLQAFNREWKAREVIAVDTRRRVLARATEPAEGTNDGAWGDDLSDARVVNEALQGYVLDDTWVEAGRVLRVAAAPVVVRDRYAGVLLVVLDLGADLAGELHEMLGADLAFVADGKIIARGGDAAFLDEAPRLVKEHAGELSTAGHTAPLVFGQDGANAMIAIALPGEAAEKGAAMVMLSERPLLGSTVAVLSRIGSMPLPWMQLIPIAGALVAVVLLGFYLMSREHDTPIQQLLEAAQLAARGERPIDEASFRGPLAAIVRAMNEALDRAVGSTPDHAIDRPPSPLPHAGNEPLPLPEDVAAQAPSKDPPRAADPGPHHRVAVTLPRLPAEPVATTHVVLPGSMAEESPLGPAQIPEASSLPSPQTRAPSPEPGLALGGVASAEPSPPKPSRPSAAGADPGHAADPEFAVLFQEYLDCRQRCNEPTEGIRYDKFAERLRQQRRELIARYGCKSVKFTVYVKAGKAALRATPVHA